MSNPQEQFAELTRRTHAPSGTPRTAHRPSSVAHRRNTPKASTRPDNVALQCPPVGDPVDARAPAPIHAADPRRTTTRPARRPKWQRRCCRGPRGAAPTRRGAACEVRARGRVRSPGAIETSVLAVACSAASRRFGAYLAR
jgi:hypothetical protein